MIDAYAMLESQISKMLKFVTRKIGKFFPAKNRSKYPKLNTSNWHKDFLLSSQIEESSLLLASFPVILFVAFL